MYFRASKVVARNGPSFSAPEGCYSCKMAETPSEILIYQSPDGKTRVDVTLADETVWLSQAQMAELFQTTKQNISLHVRNVFDENELQENSVVKEYLTTAQDGKRYQTKFYNLDVIIDVPDVQANVLLGRLEQL